MSKRVKFQTKPVSQAVGLFSLLLAATAAQAGPGLGDAYDLNNNPFILGTYFASSPSGDRQWVNGAPQSYDPANQAAYAAAIAALYPTGYPGTGKAIRKFVDPLPLPGEANAVTLADGTVKYIPIAVPTKWVNPQGVATGDDYYEIGVIEYAEKFHSDLSKPTTLRGYVQIDPIASNTEGASASAGSHAVPLTYPNGDPILIAQTDLDGTPGKTGKLTGLMVQAYAYDAPHYLGPVLTASRHVPTRLKFLNLLPVGHAQTAPGTHKEFVYNNKADPKQGGQWVDVADTQVIARNGDLFVPVDPSIQGAGLGPDGTNYYPQNRALIHLHGGDNPWISDGTPHQWITPAGELDPGMPNSVASQIADPTMVGEFSRGVGAINVPDMLDPGPGAMTYYFPNGQSARMEWYHDHSVGLTRLNVYAGMASAYLLTDDVEKSLIGTAGAAAVPGIAAVLPGADATIPLILQDKTFVPKDIELQDARWSKTGWGTEGDLWFPHVYETVQDPQQATNFNSVGRWHWGPWFWPSFPALYNLPTGMYGDVTTTPEAWSDTPVINGVAYPTLTVDPKPYRFRILNASNDRSFHFNLFVADETNPSPAPHIDGSTNFSEMKMVPVNSWLPTLCADPAATRTDGTCTPQNWSTDVYGHNGGVPDATTQGPSLMQIASEGGWLPGVAVKDPTPVNFLLDKGRAAVLNVDWSASGLYLGNGERADVVVDFTPYAGKTLLVYNDGGAPVPAADPRNEYFTGYGDNSATGGAEDTLVGYGPNSRTMMQIVVRGAIVGSPATTGNPATIDAALKAAFKASQERPVVAQQAYNGALGESWTNDKAFASIFTGSLKQPTFDFVPGTLATGGNFNAIIVTNKGDGYITPPAVTITGAPVGGTSATATASLKISHLHVINGGAGYKTAPIPTITSLGKGSGANATTSLRVSNVQVTAGGAGYSNGGVTGVNVTSGGVYAASAVTAVAITNAGRYNTANVTVTFSAPAAGGTRATGTVTMAGTGANRTVSRVNITNPGSGYTAAPTLTFSNGTTRATATATLGAAAPTVSFAAPAGGTAATGTVQFNGTAVTGVTIVNAGSGYTTAPVPTFNGGTMTTAATATTTVSAMPTVTFAAAPAGGVTATGVAQVNASGVLTGIAITNGGSGYKAMPSVTISGGGGVSAKANSFGSVATMDLTIPDPTNPASSGGGGYDNLKTDAADPVYQAALAAGNAAVSTAGLTITMTAPPAAPAGAGFTSATATAGATGKVFDVTMTKSPAGYTTQPTITLAPAPNNTILAAATTVPTQVRTTATASTDVANGTPTGSILVKTKAIQELFDPTYGRLNATFGVELPFTSALTQTTIPLGYVDQATEQFSDGETQIWKITHNGVDAHPIHFHLLNVQLVNRVGWDNFVTPPEPNELGWKETIKMSPLEDVIVAVRAKKPNLRTSSADGTFRAGAGFGLPNSVRRQDPSQPEGADNGFTQIDPNTGLPATMVNQLVDYGWEYVWHCHILGHEENDFMRPVVFNANEAIPTAADTLTGAFSGDSVALTWNDKSDSEFQYLVQRADGASGVYNTIGFLPANSNAYTDTTTVATGSYQYRVMAVGQNGTSFSNVATLVAPPAAPTGLAATATGTTVVLTWGAVTGATSYLVQRSPAGNNAWDTGRTVTSATFTDTTGGASTAYDYQVTAINAGGPGAVSAPVTVTTGAAAAVATAPLGVTASAVRIGTTTNDTITVGWNAVSGANSYTVQRCTVSILQNCNGTTGWTNQVPTIAAPAVSFSQTAARGNIIRTTYRYRVSTTIGATTSGYSTVASVTAQ